MSEIAPLSTPKSQRGVITVWFWKNLANIFTVLRTVLFFCFLAVFVCGHQLAHFYVSSIGLAGIIACLIGDALDGMIARTRWLSEVTKLGQVLDPIVDKTIWVLSLYALMIFFDQGKPPLWLVGLIVLNTVLIAMDGVSLRKYLARYLEEYDQPLKAQAGANFFGKAKFWLIGCTAMSQAIELMPTAPVDSGLWSGSWQGLQWIAHEIFFSNLHGLLAIATSFSILSLIIKGRNKPEGETEAQTEAEAKAKEKLLYESSRT